MFFQSFTTNSESFCFQFTIAGINILASAKYLINALISFEEAFG
jgi:hypothetical protein